MSVSKNNTESFALLANLSKSIGHPTRIQILRSLCEQGGTIEGEIVDIPNTAPSTVIQHLRELKRAGLIKGRIFGAQCKYSLNDETLHVFKSLWLDIISPLQSKS
jgi:DNA-binding transcriptional ArsR family regulator